MPDPSAPPASRPGRHRLFYLMNLYPPYLGAGIRIVHVARDLRTFEVRMRLSWFNRNYLGTHFGGLALQPVRPLLRADPGREPRRL